MPRRPDVLCAGGCGELMWRGKGALPEGQAMCRPCRADRRPKDESPDLPSLTCVVCGRAFPFARLKSGARTPKKTCGEPCRRELARQHGKWLGTSAGVHATTEHPCPDCGKVIVGYRDGRCEECARALYLERNRRTNVKRRGGRPRKPGMTTQQLGQRDGWRCHLCRKHVDKRLKWPHLMSASQDHLIPIACGGDDEPENIALAHWICNTRRGTRGVVQLALVG